MNTVTAKALIPDLVMLPLAEFHLDQDNGRPIAPIAASTAGRGNAEGFCVEEDLRQDGKVPQGYGYCGPDHPELLTVQEGLAVGWVDRYEWDLEGQFIYLDGLTLPGDFCVSATADPRSFFTEKTRENNATSASVRISKTGVEVIKQGC